jgi:predicted PurR-regulated permease PerM
VLDGARDFLFTVVGSTYKLVLVLMLTAFIVIDRRRISAFFGSLPPAHLKPSYQRLMEYVDRGLAGVIRGQIVICVVNGLLTWAGLQIFGVPYAALLALVAGVFSLIPVFGTIASSIPIVLVALTAGGFHAGLMALGWICLIHLLEANVFNPLIMGTSAEMHPVIIIFALLAGEHAFGVWGALLAVPTASIIQSCFKYYRHEIEGVPPEEPHGHGRWVRSLIARSKGRRGTVARVAAAEKGGGS